MLISIWSGYTYPTDLFNPGDKYNSIFYLWEMGSMVTTMRCLLTSIFSEELIQGTGMDGSFPDRVGNSHIGADNNSDKP